MTIWSSSTPIWQALWQIDFIINDAFALLYDLDTVKISHIYREGNQAADWIANVGHLVTHSLDISICNNCKLADIIRSDALGVLLVRRAL